MYECRLEELTFVRPKYPLMMVPRTPPATEVNEIVYEHVAFLSHFLWSVITLGFILIPVFFFFFFNVLRLHLQFAETHRFVEEM